MGEGKEEANRRDEEWGREDECDWWVSGTEGQGEGEGEGEGQGETRENKPQQ